MIKTNVKYSYFIWPELSVMLQHPLLRPLAWVPKWPQDWYPYQRHCPIRVLTPGIVYYTSRHEFRGVPSVLVHDIHLLSPLLPRWLLPSALSPRWQLCWSSGRRCPPPWCSPAGPAGRWRTVDSGCSSGGSSSCPRTPPFSSAAHWYRAAGRRRERFGPSPPGWGSSPSSSSGPNGRRSVKQDDVA